MFSNYYLRNTNLTQTLNLKDNQKVNIYLVSNGTDNLNKTVTLSLGNNNIVNIYCLVLSNHQNKVINFNVDHHGNNSVSNIYVKALANNNAIIKVNCVSRNETKTNKNTINQMIDGLIFDDESLIQALPCLDINVDDITAKHTVNIGQVDPEIIFYLNTKGLNNIEAYQFLIDSFLSDLNPYLTHYHINVRKDIKTLMGGKYE